MDTAAGSGPVTEQTLYNLILKRAEQAPTQPAILSAQGGIVTNAMLCALVERTGAWMHGAGFGPASRIALIMRNGPGHAAAICAFASCAACAPLNPDLAEARWQETFAALRIEAVALTPGLCGAAARAARAMNIPVIEIHGGAGITEATYRLTGDDGAPAPARARAWPTLDDTAFVLATSGTTSRPKVAPVSHRNISHSGHNTATALALTPQDRLLGVLPLHHAHGLISGLMASLAGGGSVICMEGFEVGRFFDLLSTLTPSWYTAVPAIHQAVLDAAPQHAEAIAGHGLRLVRSASAPLAPERFAALEALFEVPVIETFGMTEATSQVASNPLAPGRQKPGSVGIAAGPEIRITDDHGARCPAGTVGQIHLRGASIIRGYDDPAETRAAFAEAGWLRTGDLGYLDSEGYLFIVGRLSEVINRGGEKLMPQRIEAALRQHPGVREAVVFAAPHRRLGEDVAAAIVAADSQGLTETALRAFALACKDLSDAEIPRRILMVEAIPRNPLGKLQRARLAAHFGITDPGEGPGGTNAIPPETGTERLLVPIWAEVFNLQTVGVEEDFFQLGGDSLLAVQIALRIAERLGVVVSLRTLFETPTIRTLGAYIDSPRARADRGFELSRPVNPSLQHPASISQEHILDMEAGLGGFSSYTIPL
ncbi:MAG: non-ribosomal peptide synthetase, partial [Pseudomonadota bacterium]